MSRKDRHSDGERPHARRRKRSNTLVALNPEAAAISLIDSSGRVRSSRHDWDTRRWARHAEKLDPVRSRTTCVNVCGCTPNRRDATRSDADGSVALTCSKRAKSRAWSYMRDSRMRSGCQRAIQEIPMIGEPM